MIRYIIAMLASAVTLLAASEAAAQSRYVNANNLNCREAPEASSPIVARLPRSSNVTVEREEGGWSQLRRTPSCWVSSRYLVTDVQASYAAPAPRAQSPRSRGGSGRPSQSPRSQGFSSSSCPCSGSSVCIGPRGGRYCITSGGNKRYGV